MSQNNYQEALDELEAFNDLIVHRDMDYCTYERMKSIEHLFQELVDKETPMKPKRSGVDYRCARCNRFSVIDRYKSCGELNRCHECGQVIDWGDDNV